MGEGGEGGESSKSKMAASSRVQLEQVSDQIRIIIDGALAPRASALMLIISALVATVFRSDSQQARQLVGVSPEIS